MSNFLCVFSIALIQMDETFSSSDVLDRAWWSSRESVRFLISTMCLRYVVCGEGAHACSRKRRGDNKRFMDSVGKGCVGDL